MKLCKMLSTTISAWSRPVIRITMRGNLTWRRCSTVLLRDDLARLRIFLPPSWARVCAVATIKKAYSTELLVNKSGKLQSTKVQHHEPSRSRRARTAIDRVDDNSKLYSLAKRIEKIQDPLQLANLVLDSLRANNYEEAEGLVLAASKKMPCTVSFNHLINWQSHHGKINAALQTYNAMKKRAQVPDAHTFTILFRNMARYAHMPSTLGKALSIYHSMFSPKSPVKPTVIHTNAVLKVCARAHDIDALYGVIGRLEDKGMRGLDTVTFTTIFNAMRENIARDSSPGLSVEEMSRLRMKTIVDARRMWKDVLSRWRAGTIAIDEELVCSMGRILLFGDMRDIDDVLSLMQQTMRIPRLIPKFGSEDRARIDPSQQSQKPITSDDVALEASEFQKTRPEITSNETNSSSATRNESKSLSIYAKPGQVALALVLEVADKMNIKLAATSYWKYFTTECNIKPDRANYHSYHRILRRWRSSKESVEILRQMPRKLRTYATFQIVMSAIVRDKNSSHAFEYAEKVLATMKENFTTMHPTVVKQYTNLLTERKVKSTSVPNNTGPLQEAERRTILRKAKALQSLTPWVLGLEESMKQLNSIDIPTEDENGEKEAILLLYKAVIGALDSVLGTGVLSKDDDSHLRQASTVLNRILQRYLNNLQDVKQQKVRLEMHVGREMQKN